MIERAYYSCFLLETAKAIGVLGKRGRQDLHSYFPAQARISRTVHFAHSARA
jgi:hypothetical protein